MKSQPTVFVIIPTYNSQQTIEPCLESIANQTYPAVEIIVVDNNSKDATKKLAKQFTPHILNKGPERSAQRNAGAAIATGKYLLFIDSDMVLTSTVVADCVTALVNNDKAQMVVIPEESFGIGFWAECKALERSFYVNVPWMEAARFFSTKIFTEMHGYDETNTGTEDYDLPQRIKSKYSEQIETRVGSFIRHNEGELSLSKTLQKKFYYAQKLKQYKLNHQEMLQKQANPLERYRLFFSQPSRLLAKPHIGLGMLVLKTLELIAGSMGYLKASLSDKKD